MTSESNNYSNNRNVQFFLTVRGRPMLTSMCWKAEKKVLFKGEN